MRFVQNPGNVLDIGRAFANVSTSALLKNWNRIEVGTSNSFETLRAHALRTAFSEWALAVGHVHGLVCVTRMTATAATRALVRRSLLARKTSPWL